MKDWNTKEACAASRFFFYLAPLRMPEQSDGYPNLDAASSSLECMNGKNINLV
jgi:hypothetical protein